jgi:hypothetical protein
MARREQRLDGSGDIRDAKRAAENANPWTCRRRAPAGGEENGRRLVPSQQLRQKRGASSRERSLVYQDQPHGTAARLLGRVEQSPCHIRRAQRVIAQLPQLGPKQRTMPVIRHHKEDSGGTRWFRTMGHQPAVSA